MNIGGGEVNATLRFNVVSDKLTEAKSKLFELQEQFRAAGGAATEAGVQIKAAMADQATIIEDLGRRQAAAQAAMQNTINPNIAAINKQTDAMLQAEIAAAKQAAAITGATQATATGATAATNLGNAQAAAAVSSTSLANAATVVARPVAAVGQAAQQAGEELSGFDRLATRMVERLILFYALRETFSFTKGIFEAADAMVTLSEKTGGSIDGLETFTKAGEEANIPTKTLASSVEFLHKGLAEFKPEMADGLSAIGLSFAKIQGLNFDQTLDAILKGIEALPTQNERVSASLKLLGTDAIEPLAKMWDQYAESAKKAIPDAANVEALAQGARFYKSAFTEIKDGVELGLGAIIRWTAAINEIPMALMSGNIGAVKELIRENLVDVGLVAPGTGTRSSLAPPFGSAPGFNFPGGLKIGPSGQQLAAGAGESGELFGEKFVKSVEDKVTELSPELFDLLNRLRLKGELTLQSAVKAGADTETYKAFLQIWQEASRAIADDDIAARNLDVRIMNIYQHSQQLLTLREQERAVNFGTRDQIAMLVELDQQQKILADDTINHLKGLNDRTRVTEEYGKIHEQITKQILALEREVTKEINTQMTDELKAREALMARFGLTAGGGNLNEDDPFIKMQRQLDILRATHPNEDITERAQVIIQQYLDAEKKAADAADKFADTLDKGSNDLKKGAEIFMSQFNAITGSTDLKGKTFLIQPRAMGGPVEQGQPYLVGETGKPEIFIPGSSGGVFPMSSGMGATNVNVYVSGVWDPATVRQMADKIGAEVLRRSNRQFSYA